MDRPSSSTQSPAAVISYVERRKPEAMDQLLEGLDQWLGVPADQVRHALTGGLRWVDTRLVIEMFRRCREDIFHNPNVVYRIGYEAIILHRWGPVGGSLMRFWGTPRTFAWVGPRLVKHFTRTVEDLRVEDYDGTSCRVVVRWREDLGLNHDSCQFLAGSLTALPLSLGDPGLSIQETACMFAGAAATVYELRWSRFSLRKRLGNLWRMNVSQREEFLLGALDRQVRDLDQISRELKRTAASYRAMVRSAPDPILEITADGSLEALNSLGEELLGPAGGRRRLAQVVHPADLDLVAERISGLLLEDAASVKVVFRLAGPEARQVEAGLSRLEGPDGQTSVLALLRDVTAEREMSRRLGEQKQRFESLVEHSPLALAFVDADGRYRYLNRRFVELFGYTMEHFRTGRDWMMLAFPDPDDREAALDAWRDDFSGAPPGLKLTHVRPVTCLDGSLKYIKFHVVVMEGGEYLVLYEDISDAHQAEAALKLREAELSAVVEGSPEGVMLLDGQGRVLLANRRAAALFGLGEMTRGRRLWNLLPEAYRPWMQELWERLDRRGELVEEVELPLDGDLEGPVPCELKAVSLGEGGVYLGLADIRSRRRLEQERQEGARLAGVVELAGAAAHELNQPLTSLLAATEMMGIYDDVANLKRLGAMAADDAQNLAELVARFGRIVRYETKEYLDGTRIIDLERAAAGDPSPEDEAGKVLASAGHKLRREG